MIDGHLVKGCHSDGDRAELGWLPAFSASIVPSFVPVKGKTVSVARPAMQG